MEEIQKILEIASGKIVGLKNDDTSRDIIVDTLAKYLNDNLLTDVPPVEAKLELVDDFYKMTFAVSQ